MDLKTETVKWVNGLSNWDRGLLVTCNVHHYLQSQKDKRTLKAIERKITTLRQNIDNRIFKDKNKHTEIFPVIHRNTSSNHIHILFNTPQHMKRKHFIKDIERSIKKTSGITKAPDKYKDGVLKKGIEVMYDSFGAVDYVLKEIRTADSFETISAENIYFGTGKTVE